MTSKSSTLAKLSQDIDKLEDFEQTRPFENVKGAIYKLVETFAAITMQKIWVVNAKTASSDGRKIEAPLDDPRAYQTVEHHIAHILFKSDIQAKRMFSQRYAHTVKSKAAELGVTIHVEALENAIRGIIEILDVHRVHSLWRLLYPGSSGRIKHMRQDSYLGHADYAAFNLIVYFGAMEADLNFESERFEPYRQVLEKALQKVELKGFPASLAIAKWLIIQLVDVLISETLGEGCSASDLQDRKTRAQALHELMSNFRMTPEELPEGKKDGGDRKYSTSEQQDQANDLVDQVLRSKSKDLEDMASNTGESMRNVIEKARQTLRQKMTKEQILRKNAFAKVVFRDVGKDDLDAATYDWAEAMKTKRELERQLRATASQAKENALLHRLAAITAFLDHEAEDAETVRRLKAVFHRVMGRRKFTLEEDGMEIDIEAYIERKMTGESVPCFQQEVSGRGFKAMVLIDRSISMLGDKTAQTERACKILSRALDFPFVDLTIWGFQSMEDGQVDIIRYDSDMRLFSTADKDVGGGTPLHIATKLAVRHLEEGSQAKNLFVITDGMPFFANRKGDRYHTAQLMRWTRDEIRRGRRQGMNIVGILIGTKIGTHVKYDLRPKHMQYVFGHRDNSRFINPDRLGSDLVNLVTSRFMRYLSRG